MMFPAPASLLGAAAAILSFSSVSNIAEMYQTVGKHQRLSSASAAASNASRAPSSVLAESKDWKSVEEGLTQLQRMSRRELIELYLNCDSDDTLKLFNNAKQSKVYDGYLLDNGPVLVSFSLCHMEHPSSLASHYGQFIFFLT